jgi:hypothetical protein
MAPFLVPPGADTVTRAVAIVLADPEEAPSLAFLKIKDHSIGNPVSGFS